ncbi:leucine-rich repeat and death domain-containing protein 1-like [Halichondria panicea]|uniref:leucine-rich repeat and death domain-containing protein 1-like n=1 Tax=Halichondria panicea TaxID=6063 RepID=UPI00312B5B1F
MTAEGTQLEKILETSSKSKSTVLNLSHRSMKIIPAQISTLDHVQVLLLNNNSIIMPPEEITHLKNLVHLSLECNQLTLLPSDLHKLSTTLTFLNLSHNPLTFLPPYVSKMVNLKELWLEDIGLSSLPNEFLTLIQLQRLSLKGNDLFEINTDTLNRLSNLQWLSLAKNQLQSIDTLHLKSLTVLSLAENQFISFASALPFKCTALEYVDLHQNKISSLLPEDITALSHSCLSKIDLRNNVIIDNSSLLSLKVIIL